MDAEGPPIDGQLAGVLAIATAIGCYTQRQIGQRVLSGTSTSGTTCGLHKPNAIQMRGIAM